MNSEEQVRAVEMMMGQIAECEEPRVGLIMIQERMIYNGIDTSIGPPRIIEVCEDHLLGLVSLMISPEEVEDFKKWYKIARQEGHFGGEKEEAPKRLRA